MNKKPESENESGVTEQDAAGPQGTMFIRRADLPGQEAPAKLSAGNLSAAALIGLSDPFKGKRFKLKHDRTTVGSKADAGNDIVIPESTVSFMHARLIQEHGQWRILNILSTNGTFVNGKKIIEEPVRHGDRVRFGAVEFVFQDAADDTAQHSGSSDQETTAPQQSPVNNLWWLVLAATLVALVYLSFALT